MTKRIKIISERIGEVEAILLEDKAPKTVEAIFSVQHG